MVKRMLKESKPGAGLRPLMTSLMYEFTRSKTWGGKTCLKYSRTLDARYGFEKVPISETKTRINGKSARIR